jgi:hypothetical protein
MGALLAASEMEGTAELAVVHLLLLFGAVLNDPALYRNQFPANPALAL